MMPTENEMKKLEQEWAQNPRWKDAKRTYSAAEVVRLRGTLPIEYTLAKAFCMAESALTLGHFSLRV
jgi:isocitrate lyase